ncbi:MAG: TonB family protein [Pseudomonadota bacterium]
MIAHSGLVKIVALILAAGMHVVLLLNLVQPEAALTKGAGGSIDVRLGNTFQDLVQGGVAIAEATEVIEAVRTETSQSQAVSNTPTEPDVLRHIDSKAVENLTRSHPLPDSRAIRPHAPRSVSAERYEAVSPPMLGSVLRLVPPAPAKASNRAAAALKPQAGDDALEGSPPRSNAPTHSRSPEFRPEHIEQAAAVDVVRPQPVVYPQSAGNADRNARAGTMEGHRDAPSVSRGPVPAGIASGNAAASNYPGEVMRCISRAGRPRVSARGTAVISFSISGGGRITAVALAASSGAPRLDRAALQTVNRAGPCPAPPRGAQTNFSIRFQGR